MISEITDSLKLCNVMSRYMRLVVGITGSTGVIYGVRLLEVLKKLGIETNLIMSEWAQKCIMMETEHDLNYVKSLATEVSDDVNMAANISSGTHKTDGMIVIPCSMKTLSSVAVSYTHLRAQET